MLLHMLRPYASVLNVFCPNCLEQCLSLRTSPPSAWGGFPILPLVLGSLYSPLHSERGRG